jgi:hypothetical protein
MITVKVWKVAEIYIFLLSFLLKCSMYDSKYGKCSSKYKTWTSDNRETKSVSMAINRT